MLRICVTGGGTVAPIDDVRRIANFSTGRFASEISEAALQAGDEVWHLRTPSALAPYDRFAQLDLRTVDRSREFLRLSELFDEFQRVRSRLHLETLSEGTVQEYADRLRTILTTQAIDVVFHAAALSDYEPDKTEGKLRSGAGELLLRCVPVPKVIRLVKDWAPSVFLVGFKLLSNVSTEELVRVARASGEANRSDLTVANDYQTVRAGHHTIHLVSPDGRFETIPPGPDLAVSLLKRIKEEWSTKARRTEDGRVAVGAAV